MNVESSYLTRHKKTLQAGFSILLQFSPSFAKNWPCQDTSVIGYRLFNIGEFLLKIVNIRSAAGKASVIHDVFLQGDIGFNAIDDDFI